MPVFSEVSIAGPYVPNGSTTSFPFGFKATAADEVVAVDQDGAVISPALYSITLDDDEGGALDFSVAPQLADYSQIYVVGDPALTQPSDFDNTGPSFNPAALTRALDRAAVRDLKQQRQIDRTVRVPFGELGFTIAGVASRANKFAAFDDSGNMVPVAGAVAVAPFSANIGDDDGAGGSLWTTVAGFIAHLRSSLGASIVRFITPEPGAIARTILSRFLETRSVTDWGVTGDGSAADLIRINAALSECPANWTLVFPPKVYLLNGTALCNRSNLNIRGYGAELKAKDNTVFEHVFYADTQSKLSVRGLIFNANRANRTAGQNIRYMGAAFRLPTDCEFVDCVGTNAVGYASIPGVGLSIGGGLRSFVRRSFGLSCGGSSGTDAADGIYVSGDYCGIIDCGGKDCTDTGAVIENSNYSFIDGFFADTCNAIAAITNVTDFDKRGNWMRRVGGKDWNSSVTGGIQIGCPASAITLGKLIDTRVEASTDVVTGGKGTGPAINVRKGNAGSGGVDGLDIDVVINGASTQGILIAGLNVRVKAQVRGTTAACVQFQDGSTGEVYSSTLIGGSFGVVGNGNANIRLGGGMTVLGAGTQSYNYYAFSTSTISGDLGDSTGASVNRIGKDGGATNTVVRVSSVAFEMNGVQVLGPRMAAVPDAAAMTYVAPSGGATIDTQCRASLAQLAADVTSIRTATNTALARLRTTGQIAP